MGSYDLLPFRSFASAHSILVHSAFLLGPFSLLPWLIEPFAMSISSHIELDYKLAVSTWPGEAEPHL